MSKLLLEFTQRYIDLWQTRYQTTPYSTHYADLPSPCVIKTDANGVFWLPQLENKHSFAIAEEVMNLKINPAANDFYCVQFAGDLSAKWQEHTISLIQIWNDEDFRHFELNLLQHLEMQRKRKLRPTIFIGTTEDERQLISIDNQTGTILLETLGEKTPFELAPSLELFLNQLIPFVAEK